MFNIEMRGISSCNAPNPWIEPALDTSKCFSLLLLWCRYLNIDDDQLQILHAFKRLVKVDKHIVFRFPALGFNRKYHLAIIIYYQRWWERLLGLGLSIYVYRKGTLDTLKLKVILYIRPIALSNTIYENTMNTYHTSFMRILRRDTWHIKKCPKYRPFLLNCYCTQHASYQTYILRTWKEM